MKAKRFFGPPNRDNMRHSFDFDFKTIAFVLIVI
jgi:hypothetical protein